MPDLPARLVNALEVCWSLACQGAQVHSWVTVAAKRTFVGGGGFAEESTALLSEVDVLSAGAPWGKGTRGGDVRDTAMLLSVLSETPAGLGRAQAEHSSHPHGSEQPPVWTQHQGCLIARLHFKHAGEHFITLRLGTSVTCLSHKAWETELGFEVCSEGFKELEKVFESRIGEDETLLTSSSHLPSTLKPELTTKPSPTYSYSHSSLCQGLTPNILQSLCPCMFCSDPLPPNQDQSPGSAFVMHMST